MVFLSNLSTSECKEGERPWEFTDLGRMPSGCFTDKALRDSWINDPKTSFHVYTLYEGVQKNLRIRGTKGGEDDNPPLVMHGLAVDYDTAMRLEDAQKALSSMTNCLPAWFEQTLSGNGRLVWLFQEPILLPSKKFLLQLLDAIDGLIPFRKLPAIDERAVKEPSRYYTNGCRWTMLSRHRIPTATLRGFVLKVSEKFDWQQRELGKAVNLEDIAAECQRLFPRFGEWPGEFTLGSQGPSFWIDGSTSPKSATVRETGMQTFSAHATKAFYSWAELVGSEFVENNENVRFGKAVEGVWYDGKNFIWKDASGKYAFDSKDNFRLLLQVNKGLRAPARRDGTPSDADRAIAHVLDKQRIDGAGSCAFYPHGIFTYEGKRILNTHQIDAMPPHPEPQVWGAEGGFPFLSKFLDSFLVDTKQTERVLAWFQRIYRSCLDRSPTSGHALFIAGPVGCGKTFFSRGVVGRACGGSMEANSYLVGSDGFNSELFDYAIWVMDDGTIMSSEKIHMLFSENIKKTVANRDHRVNEKFRKAVKLPWQGRFIGTMNHDPESLRVFPNSDISILDKVFLVRAGEKVVDFYEQKEMEDLMAKELPAFLRWLIDWKPPAECFFGANVRFGITPIHDESLLKAVNLSSGRTVFVEILSRWLQGFFAENGPRVEYWEGSVTDLRVAMMTDPIYAELIRSYRAEQFPRMIVTAMNKGLLPVEISDEDERVFRFLRSGRFKRSESPQEIPPQSTNSNFSK